MAGQDSQRRLAAITDHGFFERLATAVLREADPRYRLLSHTGVNTDGKTVSSPVDGITFVEGASPPHMIVVHHTTCKRNSLKKKWLHDPATTNTKGGTRHAGEPGDLVKTVKLVRDQERSMPNLRATLILTTNQEPTESLVRQVNTVANKAGLEVAIWPNSAIAHFLDHDPQGQWIRNSFLGIAQEQLSFELLQELSRRSLAYAELPDESELWIGCQLDQELENAAGRDVLFLVGESGTGKSVACQKRLHAHIQSGGIGLIIPHRIISESLSLDQAIQGTLKSLHPPLVSSAGSVARILASERAQLLLVVEDVNKLEQPTIAIERLVSWSAKWKEHTRAVNCQLICPVWKRWLAGLTDQARKQIGRLILNASHFSVDEGAEAILRRRKHAGNRITTLQATAAATALGNDPLLIALQDSGTASEPDQVIRNYVVASLERLAASRRKFTAGEYRQGLRRFAIATLEQRSFDPSMSDVASWLRNDPGVMEILRHIAHSEEIISLASRSANESLNFRHDRVRDWLHADALATLMLNDAVPEAILADPFFAEIIGAALLQQDIPISLAERVRRSNPLALVCAIRAFGEPVNELHDAILKSVRSWLADPATVGANNKMLRWSACRLLSELDASYVISLVRCFPEEQHEWWGLCASFRNGDIAAGIEICWQHGPGVRMVGQAELIEHTCKRHGPSLVKELDEILRNSRLARDDRSGALRLAGHMGNPSLAGAVKACWLKDADRQKSLADYLWAGAQCCGDSPYELLSPICEAWACLSDESDDRHLASPRDDLAAHHIRWAFQEKLPEPAIRFFYWASGKS